MREKASTGVASCFHCGEPVGADALQYDGKPFCCTGCRTVYQVLNQHGLCDYYTLNESPGQNQRALVREGKFAFLEDEDIRRRLIQFSDGGQNKVTFYLPQMHCSSCLWLLENLSRLDPGVIESRVDFAHKEVAIRFLEPATSLKKLAELLTSIGYEPHISLNELERKPRRLYNRDRIYRLGVAGFCLGNIMLLSFPEYLGVVDDPEQLRLTPWFRYLNLLLALPVFFYSAREFFVQGYRGLRHGYLHIDAPIALAILITFLRSVVEIIGNTGGGYLDSMTGIVFFMLVGRVLQDRTQQALTFDRDYTSYFPIAVNRLEHGREVPVPLPSLRTGDTVVIHNQEIVPADGMLVRGKAAIDYSFVTGESVPVNKEMGELIYAGGRQTGGSIEMLLVKDVSQSYLTSLWNKASQHKDDEKDSFVHPLARYFTYVLFILTAAAAAWWAWKDPSKIWPVVTAMLIVACPCALLLSATFTNGHVVRALDRAGMYLRHYGILEKLQRINHIVFDKTGTITRSQAFDIEYYGDPLTQEQRRWIARVSAQSQHPLSRALARHLTSTKLLPLENFREHTGKGSEAWIEDRHILIGRPEFAWGEQASSARGSVVAIRIDSEARGMFVLRNLYRPGLKAELRKLKAHYPVSIISGDNDAERETLQRVVGRKADLIFNCSPHDKLRYVENLRNKGARVLMIGDGLNDAAALQASEVGIAVSDNLNNFSPACDAILEAGQLQWLHRFLQMVRRGRQTILASFVISILYNVVGLSFAASGQLTPMIAAILMPASSITIILFTWFSVWLSGKWLLPPKSGSSAWKERLFAPKRVLTIGPQTN